MRIQFPIPESQTPFSGPGSPLTPPPFFCYCLQYPNIKSNSIVVCKFNQLIKWHKMMSIANNARVDVVRAFVTPYIIHEKRHTFFTAFLCYHPASAASIWETDWKWHLTQWHEWTMLMPLKKLHSCVSTRCMCLVFTFCSLARFEWSVALHFSLWNNGEKCEIFYIHDNLDNPHSSFHVTRSPFPNYRKLKRTSFPRFPFARCLSYTHLI